MTGKVSVLVTVEWDAWEALKAEADGKEQRVDTLTSTIIRDWFSGNDRWEGSGVWVRVRMEPEEYLEFDRIVKARGIKMDGLIRAFIRKWMSREKGKNLELEGGKE